MAKGLGTTQQKILLLLLAGAALSLNCSPNRCFRILRDLKKEWGKINNEAVKRSIRRLYETKLVSQKENKDGSVSLVLTYKGHKKALIYKLDEMKIERPRKWDKKWRIVLFDIPERNRMIRDIFRFRLKKLGFYEFQKSVFVYPFQCRDEIEYCIELYNARKFVRFIEANFIDNELDIKNKFDV